MAKNKFKIEGLKEVEQALRELPKATGKNVLRRVATRRLEPIADRAGAGIRSGSGRLEASVVVSSRLSKRQAGLHRKLVKDSQSTIEMFAGPGPVPYAHMVEFGTFAKGPRPYLRPAWDSHKAQLVDLIGKDLWYELDQAAARLARKTARLAAKG